MRFGATCILATTIISAATLVGCDSTERVSYDDSSMIIGEFDGASDRPPTPATLYHMANMLQSQGKHPQAEAVYRNTIRQHPAFLPAYAQLAGMYVRQGRLDHAEMALQAGLNQAPGDHVLSNDLGMVYMLQDRHSEAYDAFSRAVNAAPTHERYRANMAMAAGMQGRYDEALALYNELFIPAESHYNVAVIAEARNDEERAAIEYARSEAFRNGVPADQVSATER